MEDHVLFLDSPLQQHKGLHLLYCYESFYVPWAFRITLMVEGDPVAVER